MCGDVWTISTGASEPLSMIQCTQRTVTERQWRDKLRRRRLTASTSEFLKGWVRYNLQNARKMPRLVTCELSTERLGVDNTSRHRCEVQEKKGLRCVRLKREAFTGQLHSSEACRSGCKRHGGASTPMLLLTAAACRCGEAANGIVGGGNPEQPKTPRLANDRRLSLPAFALVPDHAWRADSHTNYDALRIARQQPPSSTHRVCDAEPILSGDYAIASSDGS